MADYEYSPAQRAEIEERGALTAEQLLSRRITRAAVGHDELVRRVERLEQALGIEPLMTTYPEEK